MFRQVQALVPRPEDFQNSLYNLTELRGVILDVADTWRNSGDFAEAITLCREMPPVLERGIALRYAATFAQEWAEAVQRQRDEAAADERHSMEKSVRDRWAASGDAQAELAREIPEPETAIIPVPQDRLRPSTGWDTTSSVR